MHAKMNVSTSVCTVHLLSRAKLTTMTDAHHAAVFSLPFRHLALYWDQQHIQQSLELSVLLCACWRLFSLAVNSRLVDMGLLLESHSMDHLWSCGQSTGRCPRLGHTSWWHSDLYRWLCQHRLGFPALLYWLVCAHLSRLLYFFPGCVCCSFAVLPFPEQMKVICSDSLLLQVYYSRKLNMPFYDPNCFIASSNCLVFRVDR